MTIQKEKMQKNKDPAQNLQAPGSKGGHVENRTPTLLTTRPGQPCVCKMVKLILLHKPSLYLAGWDKSSPTNDSRSWQVRCRFIILVVITWVVSSSKSSNWLYFILGIATLLEGERREARSRKVDFVIRHDIFFISKHDSYTRSEHSHHCRSQSHKRWQRNPLSSNITLGGSDFWS